MDFPDLKKIIERDDNWKKAFGPIFSRKEILSSALSEIEPIRNKIAHNRKASEKDVEMLSTTIGVDYFDSLRSAWWFDESYLCEKIDKIIEFFLLIDEYSHLPRSRGTGHGINL